MALYSILSRPDNRWSYYYIILIMITISVQNDQVTITTVEYCSFPFHNDYMDNSCTPYWLRYWITCSAVYIDWDMVFYIYMVKMYCRLYWLRYGIIHVPSVRMQCSLVWLWYWIINKVRVHMYWNLYWMGYGMIYTAHMHIGMYWLRYGIKLTMQTSCSASWSIGYFTLST